VINIMTTSEAAQSSAAPSELGRVARGNNEDEEAKPAGVLARLGLDVPTVVVLLK
jgi:hypothetical protein